jgi:hypothetical protein
MADKFPSANVIGVDLSPIQPTWVAPNCSFEIDDMTMPWTFAPGTFDYIHIREMFGSVLDWDGMFSEAYNALQPGGWIENAEHSIWPVSDDDSIGPDHIFTKYGSTMTELTMKMGKESDVWKKNKERMIKAGFVDVVEKRYKWPMRGWSSDPKMKELGRWNQLRVNQGIEGFAMRILTNVGGVSLLFSTPFCKRFGKGVDVLLTLIVVLYRGSSVCRTNTVGVEGQKIAWIPGCVSLLLW